VRNSSAIPPLYTVSAYVGTESWKGPGPALPDRARAADPGCRPPDCSQNPALHMISDISNYRQRACGVGWRFGTQIRLRRTRMAVLASPLVAEFTYLADDAVLAYESPRTSVGKFSRVRLQLWRYKQLMTLVNHLLNLACFVHLEIMHQLHLLLLIQTVRSCFLTPPWIEVICHLVALIRCIVLVVQRRC
jgi:hypothetical protein